ncbi:hypothetical protein C8R45DRAFT_1130508 [Mycena sanguinolenta]|nr:hypothetical protein C8R45DRAFT_1130508 [Mycena sanguinolenta]
MCLHPPSAATALAAPSSAPAWTPHGRTGALRSREASRLHLNTYLLLHLPRDRRQQLRCANAGRNSGVGSRGACETGNTRRGRNFFPRPERTARGESVHTNTTRQGPTAARRESGLMRCGCGYDLSSPISHICRAVRESSAGVARAIGTPQPYICVELAFAMHPLTLDVLNPQVQMVQYAVRGELAIKAETYRVQLQRGDHNLPFDKVISLNIGNPHQNELDQPLRARLGPRRGPRRRRRSREGAAHATARDRHPASPDDILLTAGVSLLINMLVVDPTEGVLIPIAQYPASRVPVVAAMETMAERTTIEGNKLTIVGALRVTEVTKEGIMVFTLRNYPQEEKGSRIPTESRQETEEVKAVNRKEILLEVTVVTAAATAVATAAAAEDRALYGSMVPTIEPKFKN